MSKLVLLDKTVINIITELLTDTTDQYSPCPTEWPNRTTSDVLYMPIQDTSSPINIEVQHSVDNDFILRLMSYSISAIQHHNTTPPIILVFVVSSIKYEVSKRLKSNRNHPFLLQYPSQPWARHCYFVSKDSISYSLQKPLLPFVALSMFLITQHASLFNNPFHDDLTVQQLYAISRRVFGNQITNQVNINDDILKLCSENKETFEEVLSLIENISDVEVKTKAQEALQHGLLRSELYTNKYQITDEHLPPGPSEISPRQNPHLAPAPSQIPPPKPNSNWEYVENLLSSSGNESVSWPVIFAQGKSDGYFSTYSSSKSLKASYFRWKKKQI